MSIKNTRQYIHPAPTPSAYITPSLTNQDITDHNQDITDHNHAETHYPTLIMQYKPTDDTLLRVQ
jgi:hypothetical protein